MTTAPPAAAAAAATTTTTAAAPVEPKPEEAAPPPASSGFGFMGSPAGGAEGVGGGEAADVAPAVEADAPPAAEPANPPGGSSGFSFLSSPAPPASPDTPAVDYSSPADTAEEAAKAKRRDSKGESKGSIVNESKGSPAVDSPAASISSFPTASGTPGGTSATSAATVAHAVPSFPTTIAPNVQPKKIRKKRAAKRPGFARDAAISEMKESGGVVGVSGAIIPGPGSGNGEGGTAASSERGDAGEAPSTDAAASSGASSGGGGGGGGMSSLLAGLTIHGGDAEGGAGMMAGLTVHQDGDTADTAGSAESSAMEASTTNPPPPSYGSTPAEESESDATSSLPPSYNAVITGGDDVDAEQGGAATAGDAGSGSRGGNGEAEIVEMPPPDAMHDSTPMWGRSSIGSVSGRSSSISKGLGLTNDASADNSSDSGAVFGAFLMTTKDLTARLQDVHLENEQLLANKERLTGEFGDLTLRVQQAEDNQNAAIEAEDYERADALNDTIEELKGMMASSEGRRLKVDRDLQGLAAKRELLQSDQLQSAEGVVEQVRGLWQTQRSLLKEHERTASSSVRTERRHLNVQEQRVKLDEEHLHVDQAEISEEEERLARSIEEQTEGIASKQKALLGKQEGLDGEIEELRQLLAAKETERADVHDELEACNQRIAVIRTKFDGKQTELRERRAQASSFAAKCQDTRAEIGSARKTLDIAGREAVERRASLRDEVEGVKRSLWIAKQLAAALREKVRRHVCLFITNETYDVFVHSRHNKCITVSMYRQRTGLTKSYPSFYVSPNAPPYAATPPSSLCLVTLPHRAHSGGRQEVATHRSWSGSPNWKTKSNRRNKAS